MKTLVSDLKENDAVDTCFLVKEKASAITKTGSPYLKLRLVDRSGEIEGRLWNGVDQLTGVFEKDDFVRVKGKGVSYQDRLQLNVTHLRRAGEEEIDLADYFAMAETDPEEMFQSLLGICAGIRNPWLSRLLTLLWEDSDFVARFKRAPAAKELHHTFLGGLLEHTLSVARLVLQNGNHYPGLNLDLLLAGAILHDIGKVDELSYRRSFDYTEPGRLLGHIVLGLERVDASIRRIDGFPEDLALLLKHLLVSHHGQTLWGSPKKPMILEGVMLHYLDDLDAKMNGIRQFLRAQVPAGAGWSPFHRMYDQFFYLPPVSESEDTESSI
jgi:3'-5' exoribonuclease